ncbi:MAG: hypothetical protein ACLVG5_11490 [Clostridium sp.]
MKKSSFDEKVGWADAVSASSMLLCAWNHCSSAILAGALGFDEKETAFLSSQFLYKRIAILIQVLESGRQIPDCSGVVLCTLKSHDPDR